MNLVSYIFGIAASVLSLVVVVELLRRHRLRERHAAWWFVAGILALIASVFPSTLNWTASLIGIAVPINLVFFVSIIILFLVCLQQSSELTTLESKTRVLAETVALLEIRLETLESDNNGRDISIDGASRSRPAKGPADKR